MIDDKSLPESVADILQEANQTLVQGLPLWVFARVAEQLPVAVCISDLDSKLVYANSAFSEITGYSIQDVMGEKASLLSHQCTPGRVYEQMWDRLVQGKSWTGLLVNRRKYGAVYLAELTVAPLMDEHGKTGYYLGMHRDVTAIHRLEQQVVNQKALIESMVDVAPAVIALLNENGQVIFNNHEYKKLSDAMQGREPAKEFLRALRESMGDFFQRERPVNESFQDKEVSFEPGGSAQARWFSCSGIWFREHDDSADAFFKPVRQTYLLLIATEITGVKRQQEAMGTNAMRALMAEQERVRGMRETLEAAIFQMQGPMNLIAAAHDMLNRRGQTQDMTALQSVLSQALSTGRQSLAKLQKSIPEVPPEAVTPVNINQLLREVLSLSTERLLASGIVVEWTPAPVLPAVPAREDRLRGMFKQLVDNALDAMESFRSKRRELRIVTATQEEDLVMVSIEDTGPGVPEELRLKIFEPFYTSKGTADRIGLGLAMVQDVVNEHRGIITIDPDYGDGCRFQVLLPMAARDRGSETP